MLQLEPTGSAKRWLKVITLSLATVLFLTAIGIIAYQIMRPLSDLGPAKTVKQAVKDRLTVADVQSKMLVVGDVYWGRYTNQAAMNSPEKYAFPFARLNEFGRDKYDAWIGDMECPVTDLPQPTAAEEESTLSFNCSDKYMPEMSKWFTAMTLANNHTDNRGVEGFNQTQDNLEKYGVQHFGTYDPEDLNNLCDVITLPARAKMSDSKEEKVSLPVAFCGYHGVFQIPSSESVAEITKYSKYLPVVALPHSGAEYKASPDQIKTTLYRSMIDAGADVVVGDHPHWVQSTEAYRGHLILYSLGNFMFDQQFNSEVTRSVGLVMDVTADAADNPDLAQWLKLAKTCETYHDTCLDEAAKQNLAPLKLTYDFSIVGADNLGRQTHPATAAQYASLLQRLNWAHTIQGLSGAYSGK